MQKILLITPPFTQLSSPYPAVPFLAGTLARHQLPSEQMDLGLACALHLFSAPGLTALFRQLEKVSLAPQSPQGEKIRAFLQRKDSYIHTVAEVVAFLQGKNNAFAYKIIGRSYLPEFDRFALLDSLQEEKGNSTDYARIIASLYIDDLTDLYSWVLPGFNLCKYQEQLVESYNWEKIRNAVEEDNLITSFIDEYLHSYDWSMIDIVGITIPFPGALTGALRTAGWFKKHQPQIKVVCGGGYVNTELSCLEEKEIFDFTDYIIRDNGELPLLRLIDYIRGVDQDPNKLVRTYALADNRVVFYDNSNNEQDKDIAPADLGVPIYENLPLSDYFAIIETTNPMHRLWSERIFIKLRLALGCYYHKCRFCDTALDYIGSYKPLSVELVIKQIEQIIKATGITAFHFVDEALPPALLRELALELLRRDIRITYWGNIRFDSLYDYDLCRLLKQSGLIAVTGGLESAADKMLNIMQKGFTSEQAVRVCHNFSRAGILVHCYLIYGLPREEPADLFHSLEIIRQMFVHRIIHSAYYHRFALTLHSEFYQNADQYGLILREKKQPAFANYGVAYNDACFDVFTKLAGGIEKAVYNFNYRNCLTNPLGFWFNDKSVKPGVDKFFVQGIMKKNNKNPGTISSRKKPVFLGATPLCYDHEGARVIHFSTNTEIYEYALPEPLAEWMLQVCTLASYRGDNKLSVQDMQKKFPGSLGESFDDFLHNELFEALQSAGLIFV